VIDRPDIALPKSWSAVPLSDAAQINPRDFDLEPADNDPVSFVPMASVEAGSGRLDASATRFWSEVKKGFTRFQENDVLFAKITPCMENAKFALASRLFAGRGAGSTEFHVIRPSLGIQPTYILFFLLQESVRRDARLSMKGAAGQLRVPPEFIERLVIPIPPPVEQLRIVAEIEKQITRLDAAVAALKRVQTNLKRYRGAILKDACEGRLVPTEAEVARREHLPYEPASILLERMLVERRSRWETSQLAKLRTSSVAPSDAWRAKYPNPEVPEIETLPPLPEGWTWTTLSQLSEIQGGIQKQPSRKPAQNSYPFLRVANVLRGRLDLSEIHQIELFKGELEKLRLAAGDLLIVEGNGSPSEIGRMAIWRGEIENCVHQNHIIRSRLLGGMLPAYVAAYWNSRLGASSVLKVASSTSGLYTLSVSKVGRIPIPLPPLAEQERIIAEIERCLSVNDELDSQLEANVKRAERLRQSVFKSAFQGKLAPQDPNDEPATVLLERIRAEKETALAKRRSFKVARKLVNR
jgi:type I restriction enzyme S subunit